jgi:serine/threonine-protein kinase
MGCPPLRWPEYLSSVKDVRAMSTELTGQVGQLPAGLSRAPPVRIFLYLLDLWLRQSYNPGPLLEGFAREVALMPVTSVASLVAALRESQALAQPHLEEVAHRLQRRFSDPRALARELLQRGWLTAYQINQVFLGRGGDLVLGPYVLLERLGEGGMGQVFKARHQTLKRIVALKVIRKDRLDSREAIRRFRREIQAASRLSHPNIVAAYDAGEIGNVHYIAMEYVDGKDLSQLVRDNGPLPVDEACDYLRQAALGLQHALEKGLVHRDIKPSNLMVTRGLPGRNPGHEPMVKILDMGLARLVGDKRESTLTQVQTTLGSPDFISPEQARDARQADIRSDLYSLGCTLYYLLTARVPFPADASMEKLLKHWLDEPRPVEELRPDVPPKVAAILRRLMAKRPEDRYQAPIELVAALAALMAHDAPAEDSRSQGDTWSASSGSQPPVRRTAVPTPVQETILPTVSGDTGENPLIASFSEAPRQQSVLVIAALVTVAVMVVTVLALVLLTR